jgi:predicted nucleotidyltransferase
MNDNLAHLRLTERDAIEEWTTRLLAQHGRRVIELWLFGSKARGDFDADSDLDLLIILSTDDPQVRDSVRLLAARVSLEHNVLINTHIVSQERWGNLERQNAVYWQNIHRDGIPLSMPETAWR